MSHEVLASPIRRTQVLPAQSPAVAALQISFALVPAQALDHGWIIFEKSSATAQHVSAALIIYLVAQAQRVRGIDQNKAKRLIQESVSVSRNAIVEWGNLPVKDASRKLIASCLR